MECCKNELGNFPHTEEIKTGLISSQTGSHKLEFFGPNFASFSKQYYFFAGAEIIIPQGVLNEDSLYKLKIKQPDGTYYEKEECENFTFRTYIETNNECKPCGDADYDYI